MNGFRSSLLVILAIGTWITPAQEPASRPAPTVEYRVSCELGDDSRIHVEVRVRNLDRARRDVRLELPGWGEWYDLDDYYVRNLRSVPPVRHDEEFLERFQFDLPERWDGTLTVSYDLPIVSVGSRARMNHGLLPWKAKGYVHAFTTNTLMRVVAGEARQDADRSLTLVPPRGWGTFTGWTGYADGERTFKLPPDADNTLMVFGKATSLTRTTACGGIEVVQFGDHEERTAAVIDLARRMRSAFERTTGAPPPGIVRIVVTEPGLGGTHVEGAITIGHPNLETNDRFDVGTAHFLAHEMFHSWLPGVLKPGEPGLEWFFEGFTDYFSLWHLASSGLVTAQEFGDRLRLFELLAARSPAFGSTRFDDPKVDWRKPDAEVVAYKGGALLAFQLDVALRAAGKPGLGMLFRDLVRENDSRYTLDAIRRWVEAQGLGAFWSRHVATGKLADTGDALMRIGFVETFEGKSRILKGVSSSSTTAPFFTFDPRPGPDSQPPR